MVWRFVRDDTAGSFGSTSAYKIDYAGFVLLTAVMVSSLLAINQAGKLGISSSTVVGATGVTAIAHRYSSSSSGARLSR